MIPETYLMQITDIDKEINSLVRQRDKLKATILGSSRLEHDKSFSMEVGRPTEELIIKLDEYDIAIDERLDDLVALKGKISREINQVKIRNHRNLLRDRYINGMSWGDIAECMNYSGRYIYDVHRNALKEFKRTHPDKEWL